MSSRGPTLLLAAISSVAVIYFLWFNKEQVVIPQTPPPKEPLGLCDPFAEPGFLHYDTTAPKTTQWIPYGESCDPAPNWLALIDARDTESLSFLVNRTILVLGDSVDRNGLEHLAVMCGLPRYPVPYDDFSAKGKVPEGWDERGIPWVIEIPWLNTTFTNGFMYGLDDEDNFRQQPDWHPPGKAEDRVDKLFKVHTGQLKYPPSFISIHSGLWDLAFFGRQDRVRKLSSEIPLTHQRLLWWQKRMTDLLHHVNQTWPGTPIWLRKLHRVGPVDGASYDWRHTGTGDAGAPEHFSNFFTDVRIHQIREMQEQVAHNVGVPSFDFGEIWEGWQGFQQRVHPLLFPGGPAFVQGLIHHIWMESQGRDQWALTKTRQLSPLGAVPTQEEEELPVAKKGKNVKGGV
ncbi:hypothetical protein T439DRAFT_329199 [Meredithblackwellia eburnea MCA 4105]